MSHQREDEIGIRGDTERAQGLLPCGAHDTGVVGDMFAEISLVPSGVRDLTGGGAQPEGRQHRRELGRVRLVVDVIPFDGSGWNWYRESSAAGEPSTSSTDANAPDRLST